jgi:hypothetical protein
MYPVEEGVREEAQSKKVLASYPFLVVEDIRITICIVKESLPLGMLPVVVILAVASVAVRERHVSAGARESRSRKGWQKCWAWRCRASRLWAGMGTLWSKWSIVVRGSHSSTGLDQEGQSHDLVAIIVTAANRESRNSMILVRQCCARKCDNSERADILV